MVKFVDTALLCSILVLLLVSPVVAGVEVGALHLIKFSRADWHTWSLRASASMPSATAAVTTSRPWRMAASTYATQS
jgi:hypothetical protein